MKKTMTMVIFLLVAAASAGAAPSVDPALTEFFASSPLALGQVVITFNHQPTSATLASLQALGISGGIVLNRLPMVLTAVNRTQFEALRSRSDVVSLYANHMMELHTNVSRSFIGVTALRKDKDLTKGNGGLPISGKGIGVAIVDTGIDATHADLQLGKNVVQNVFFPLAELATFPTGCPAIAGLPGVSFNFGLVGPVFVENAPISDAEGGHGTFVSGVVGGIGQASGGFYGGVAPGASLIGLVAGNDCGLATFAILQAFDYVLVKQVAHNIRVVNNSWGSPMRATAYDPNSPINVATRNLHDHNITVVFSAGNSGSIAGAINRHAVAPWVLSVAASDRESLGRPAGFSSRGTDNGTGTDTAGQPANPFAPPNLRPDVTGPGVNIKSTRSKGAGVTNTVAAVPLVGNDAQTIAPAFLPFYTTSQGTSFSAPHVTGVVALMLEANPTLTPDEVITILRQTATPMPFEERVVGAGYVDAHNAVRTATGLASVPHPADLSSADPEIVDPANDQTATTAQDLRVCDLSFDAVTNQIIYTIGVTDLSARTTNMRWTLGSNFGAAGTTVFVAANTTETGGLLFQYGRITINPTTGGSTQETLGQPDSGEIVGNQFVIRLGIDKINAAVGGDALGTTTTAVIANTWTRLGTTLTTSLLLNADTAGGTDFKVGEPPPPPPPPPPPHADFCERLAGAFFPGDGVVEIPVEIRLPFLDAKLNFHPGNEDVLFQLVEANGNLVANAEFSNGKRIVVNQLASGSYRFRLSGTLSNAIDFVVNSCQFSTAPTE